MAGLFFFSGTLIYVSVLLTNAIAILSEERFLAKIGWSTTQLPTGYDQTGYGGESAGDGIKARIIMLVSAVRTLLRAPLIIINLLLIMYELLLG